MTDINVDLLQWVIFFLKKFLVEQLKMKLFLIKNCQKNYTNQLLENLIKKVHSPIIDNTWSADLADMKVLSKFNKGSRFLLCVVDFIANMHGLLF